MPPPQNFQGERFPDHHHHPHQRMPMPPPHPPQPPQQPPPQQIQQHQPQPQPQIVQTLPPGAVVVNNPQNVCSPF